MKEPKIASKSETLFALGYATFPKDKVSSSEALMALPDVRTLCKAFYMRGALDEANAEAKVDDLDNVLGKIDKAVELLRTLKAMSAEEPEAHASVSGLSDDASIDRALASLPEGHKLDSAHLLNTRTGKVHELDVRGKSQAELRAMIAKAMGDAA